jgi:small subunit ribosomal protein S9
VTPAGDSEGTPPDEPRGDDEVVEPTPAADPGESPAAGSGDEEVAQETDAPPPAAEAPADSDPSAEAQGEAAAESEQPAEAGGEAGSESSAEARGEPDAQPEQPAEAGGEPDVESEQPAEAGGEAAAESEQPADAAPAAEDMAPPAAAAESEPSADSGQAAAERRTRAPRGRGDEREGAGEEVVPGAHLEPDLVLDEPQAGEDEFAQYAVEDEPAPEAAAAQQEPQARPVARTPMDLAADARYLATGKRKSAVARVILRPGDGSYRINGRELAEFFPRETLRVTARQPLDAAGYSQRMDVVAKIHGGGVSSQAGALRHGIARALVEADPNLRAELKRRGFLTRDARQKERKKAGLKKARKRPQFSKR